ncbi:MAG: hypothetical protein M1130_01425 [Actinobacteria bacterium]|nr:hypothetical protein [Actinomycetota bacterium]
MPDLSLILSKLSDPIFSFTLLEFLAALGLWVHSLVKRTGRRKMWFVLAVITLLIFLGASHSPYVGK